MQIFCEDADRKDHHSWGRTIDYVSQSQESIRRHVLAHIQISSWSDTRCSTRSGPYRHSSEQLSQLRRSRIVVSCSFEVYSSFQWYHNGKIHFGGDLWIL